MYTAIRGRTQIGIIVAWRLGIYVIDHQISIMWQQLLFVWLIVIY